MNTSEVLNRAADLIEERGWTHGSGWDDIGGPLCLEGAIFAAAQAPVHSRCPAYYAVRDYLSSQILPFLWNDSLTHNYVMAAIERGESLTRGVQAFRAEGAEYAKGVVIAVLRAAAELEAAKDDADTREQGAA